MTEINLAEYQQKNITTAYDWISAFMGNNPTWTLDRLFDTPKWKQGQSRYDVFRVKLKNGLVYRSVVRKEDNAEVFRELPHDARGGVRENAGRKTKDESGKAVTVSFSCSPGQKEKLQEQVKKSGLKQSEYILSKLF